jgi:glycosyltransferase involved in cell wall biosynthesis
VKHLFVTQDYAPDLGGMARRHVELCRRFADGDTTMEVSTVSAENAATFDASESYAINRQPFPFSKAKVFTNQLRWGRWLSARAARDIDVLHCGNIRPVGYAVLLAHLRRRVPFLVYVNGGDLLKEQAGIATSARKRFSARHILGAASGIVATSRWVSGLAGDLMQQLGIKRAPPIGAFDLGTDPEFFNPARDTGRLRAKWAMGDAPLLLTVARLIPHKGQDIVVRALAVLKSEFPTLRYAMIGTGPDEPRLRKLARELNVYDRVIFAGPVSDDEVAEAYATSTVYMGLSRTDKSIDAEGFGISFVEASASGVPIIAGDSGGVRSAVRDGESGIIVPPQDLNAVVEALRAYLIDPARRTSAGMIGRSLVETYYNWDRVARDTRNFTYEVVKREAERGKREAGRGKGEGV